MPACHRQIRSEGKADEEAKNTRRRIPMKRRRKPATTGTLIRSYLVWALHPGAEYSASESSPSSKHSCNAQRSASSCDIPAFASYLHSPRDDMFDVYSFAPWSLLYLAIGTTIGTAHHDVFEIEQNNEIEEKRRKKLVIKPKMRPILGCITCHLGAMAV